MELIDHLSVPYKLVAYPVKGEDGMWRRRAEYPEIECHADADTLVEAIANLEDRRIEYITKRFRAGLVIPVPRPPLRSLRVYYEHGLAQPADS